MQIGQLREQITIQEETLSDNLQGGFTNSWGNIATAPVMRAAITGLSGNEAMHAGIERDMQTWRVVIRKRGDITVKHRLQWNGLTLDIKAIMPLPEDVRFFTLLICESGLVV